MKKILFVNPVNYKSGYYANILGRVPYLGPIQLVRLTPEDIETEIVDEVAREFNPEATDEKPELAAVSVNFTSSATRGYQIADALRKQGIKVIIGGNHATYCAEEAKRHADSVVMGEADEIWETVLEDARKNNLQPLYKAPRLPDLSSLQFKRKRNPTLDFPPIDTEYIVSRLWGDSEGDASKEMIKTFMRKDEDRDSLWASIKTTPNLILRKLVEGDFDGLLGIPVLGSIFRAMLQFGVRKAFLPFLLKNLDLYFKMFDQPLGGYPIRKVLQVGRGCPVDCEFCSVTAFNGKRYRHYRMDQLLADIEELAGSGKGFDRFIFFADDNIVADPRFAKEFFREIKPLKLHWYSQATIQMARDPELLNLAADSGCVAIFYGLETLKQDTLKAVDKGFKASDYVEVIKRTHDAGIGIFPAAFVFGLPGDTPEDIERTAEFCIEQGIEFPQFTILTPLPGTRLWKRLYGDRLPKESAWEHFTYQEVVDPGIFQSTIDPNKLVEYWVGAFKRVCSEEGTRRRMGKVHYRTAFAHVMAAAAALFYKAVFHDTDYWKRLVTPEPAVNVFSPDFGNDHSDTLVVQEQLRPS